MEGKHFAAIVLAAGRGKRMQSKVQKQFMLLDGKPVLYYSLAAFEESPVDDVILVTGKDEIEYCQKEIVERFGFKKVRAVIAGGEERYHSVYEGLKAVERLGGAAENRKKSGEEAMVDSDTYVLIHDGARPFVTGEIIGRVMEDALCYGACVAGMPSKDTVKIADKDGYAGFTPERSAVWLIQTPQAFDFSLIKGAYDKMMSCERYQEGVTDDAMVVESMTESRVRLTEGSYRNIKVTTPEDMIVAEAFLRGIRSEKQAEKAE